MKSGDYIMFRGSKRFVVLSKEKSHSLTLQKVLGSGPVARYTIGPKEWDLIEVVAPATPATTARARRLLESNCSPWTRIVWGDDGQPTYVHHVNGTDHVVRPK